MNEVIVHTGQHYDPEMSQRFFDELKIPAPRFNLGIHGKSHGEMTGQMLSRLESLYMEQKPDLILVYGDTNSTLAGALAASKLNIPVAHVEAGLRSFNRRMPEEINRVLTDHLSALLFAPTPTAVSHLKAEGISGEMITLSGDVMFDSVLYFRDQLRPAAEIILSAEKGPFGILTFHRAENTDDPERLKIWIDAIKEVAETYRIIFPIHPRTQAIAKKVGINFDPIRVIPPVGYQDMLYLLSRSQLVLTDSGGLQKEAYFSGAPCLTLRAETEWTELTSLGVNKLVGDPTELLNLVRNSWGHRLEATDGPYGSGQAGDRIVSRICDYLDSN